MPCCSSVCYFVETESGDDVVSTSADWSGWAQYSDDYWSVGNPFSVSSSDGATKLPNNCQGILDMQKPLDIDGPMVVPTSIDFISKTSAFTIGETLTGSTSLATALITAIDDNGTSGVLYLENVSGSFVDSELITDSVSGSATTSGTLTAGVVLGRSGDGATIVIDFKIMPTSASDTTLDLWIDIGGAVGELYRSTFNIPKGADVEHGVNLSVGAYMLGTFEANGGTVYVETSNDVDFYDMRTIVTRSHRAR